MDAVNSSELGALVEAQSQSVFHRIAGLTLQSAPAAGDLGEDAWSLHISAQGDYQLTFLMCAGWDVWRAIARSMNHGKDVPQENVFLYVGELFNILCGCVISALNTKYQCSARFSVPQILQGKHTTPAGCHYCCECGPVELSVTGDAVLCGRQGVSGRP